MAKNKTKTTMETSFSSTSKSFPQTLHFDFDLKKFKKNNNKNLALIVLILH